MWGHWTEENQNINCSSFMNCLLNVFWEAFKPINPVIHLFGSWMRGWVGRVIYAQPNPSSYIICNFPSQEVRGWSQISGGGTPADNQSNQFHLCHRRNHIDQMEILRVAKSLIPMLFLLVFLASAISSASKIYGLSLKKRQREKEGR